MRLFMQAVGGGLPGNGRQRGVVHIGIGHPGDKVGGTGAEGGQADTGHEGGTLLVSDNNEGDARIEQGIHDI